MTNYAILGFFGALIFAFGGALAFYSLHHMLTVSWLNETYGLVSGFFSFLLVGVGLWLIAQSTTKDLKEI